MKWKALDEWIKAASEIGVPHIEDFNTGDNFGTAYFHVNQRKGWRLSAYQAFISSVLKERPNLWSRHTLMLVNFYLIPQKVKKCRCALY